MRRAPAIFVLVLSGLATIAAADTPKPPDQARTMSDVIDHVITNENRSIQQIRQYSPLVETYIQNLKPDKELGYVPAGDKYFLGRADFSKGVALVSLTDTNSKGKKIIGSIGNFFSFSAEFIPGGFLQMIFIDTNGFDKQHYKFDYVRKEFLGEVRCFVFDVTPLEKAGKGRFLGRIWVEDQDYNIVRFNGGYSGNGHASWYFHFDSWRTNVQPGVWMPTFVYSQENDVHYAITKRLDFKAQTRLWGYNLGRSSQEQELSKILVETPVQDETKTANDLTPIQAQRSWDRQAEDSVIDRFERIGLIAPKGDVDKVLDTVVNNLEVTNNIDVDPEVRCRVLTTSTLESFTIGHTIVLSRGLIDVLPDEASLATMLAHELGHVVLAHRMDPTLGFFDNLLVEDKDTFRHFGFARTPEEERTASEKAAQILDKISCKSSGSPAPEGQTAPSGGQTAAQCYQFGNAGLFLRALEARQKQVPNLISGHLGNRVPVVPGVKSNDSGDTKQNPQMIAALPLGGRVKLDPWNDKLEMIKSKPIGTVAEREKMPFEVTPFMPYLTRYGSEATKPIAASTAAPAAQTDPKPADATPVKPQENPR